MSPMFGWKRPQACRALTAKSTANIPWMFNGRRDEGGENGRPCWNEENRGAAMTKQRSADRKKERRALFLCLMHRSLSIGSEVTNGHTHSFIPRPRNLRVRDHTHRLHNQSMDSFGRRDRPLSYSSHNISLQINPHSKWQGELDDSLPGNFVHNYFLSMGASHIHRRLNLNAQCLTKTFPPAICSVKQIN